MHVRFISLFLMIFLLGLSWRTIHAQTLSNDYSSSLPETNGIVHGLASDGDFIYIVGVFTEIGGIPRPGAAAWNIHTRMVDPDWAPEIKSQYLNTIPPTGMACDGQFLYIAGRFTQINDTARNGLAALELAGNGATGEADSAWNPDPDGTVWTVHFRNNRLYVGGGFQNIGAPRRNHRFLAALLPAGSGNTGAVDPAWYLTFRDPPQAQPLAIWTLGSDQNRLFASSLMLNFANIPLGHVAALNLADGVSAAQIDTAWQPEVYLTSPYPNIDGNIYSIVSTPDAVYIGGYFTEARYSGPSGLVTVLRTNVLALHPPNGSDPGSVISTWDVGLGNKNISVRALALYRNTLILGGELMTTIPGYGAPWTTSIMQVGLAGTTTGAESAWRPKVSMGIEDVYINPAYRSYLNTVLAFDGGVVAGGRFDHVNLRERDNLAVFYDSASNGPSWTHYQ